MTGIITQNVGRPSGLIKASEAGGGSLTLIKSQTASSTANIDFVNGTDGVVLDSTYPIYKFAFINIHPATAGSIFKVNFSDDTSSHSYDLTKQTTQFYARHDEDGSDGQVVYNTGGDSTQSTGDQEIVLNTNNNNDSSASGELCLFDPSSTTFIKHFMVISSSDGESSRCFTTHTDGFINTTAAVTAVRFTFGGANIDAGKIKLYGIKDS
jgi:hypothetical protein